MAVGARTIRAGALALVALVGVVLIARGVADLGAGLHLLGGGGQPDELTDEVKATLPEGVPDDAQAAIIDGVVDGDTVRVTIEEPGGRIPVTGSVRVRLLNIDTPELDHPDRGEDCGAVEATELVEALVPAGSEVWLAGDVEDRDRYDRPLRGLWTSDGVFVNAEVVRAGWAEVVLFEPNDRFHDELLRLESEARQRGAGAWEACGGFP